MAPCPQGRDSGKLRVKFVFFLLAKYFIIFEKWETAKLTATEQRRWDGQGVGEDRGEGVGALSSGSFS